LLVVELAGGKYEPHWHVSLLRARPQLSGQSRLRPGQICKNLFQDLHLGGDVLGHAGWIFANIVVPYLFPFIVIRALQKLKLDLKQEQHERMRLTYLLREAQLSVGSVAIASAGMFELLSTPDVIRTPLGVTLTVALGLLLVANAILFVCGTIIGSPPPVEAVQAGVSRRQWMESYPMAAGSLYLAVAVSLCAFGARVITDEHRQVAPVPASKADSTLMGASAK
jgi:hypothetical protein